jgi:hypothetical protein
MKGRFVTRQLDPQKVADLLEEVMPIDKGAEPRTVTGWFQGGDLRRVRADYPNGWRLQFMISTDGYVSRVQATLRLVMKARKPV